MKADTWKAVFAAMSPSPVFQAMAELAELWVDHRRSAPQADRRDQWLSRSNPGTANGSKSIATRAD
jgi:hypothetical protein